MPLPKKRKTEKKDDFLQRCMSEPIMVKDFKDSSQRYAVCVGQLKK